MTWTVRPAQPEDVPSLMDIYFAAFKNDLDRLYFPDTPVNRQCWTRDLLAAIKDPDAHVLLAIDDSDGTGPIAGWSQWALCDAREITTRPDYLDPKYWTKDSVATSPDTEYELSPDVAPEVVYKYLDDQWSSHARVVPRDHWYLDVIATLPKYQRQGVGSLLISHGLKIADAMKLEVYLEGSPMAVPLYFRFGFKEQSTITFDSPDQTRHQVIMLRQSDESYDQV